MNRLSKALLLAATLAAPAQGQTMIDPALLGMWVSPDGHIRLELLPNGRYDEARGTQKSAYKGRYTVDGNKLEFFDDSGFTASGKIENGTLSAGPDRFRKEQ